MTRDQISTLRNCWEACMPYETAIGCAGLDDTAPVRSLWAHFDAVYAGAL